MPAKHACVPVWLPLVPITQVFSRQHGGTLWAVEMRWDGSQKIEPMKEWGWWRTFVLAKSHNANKKFNWKNRYTDCASHGCSQPASYHYHPRITRIESRRQTNNFSSFKPHTLKKNNRRRKRRWFGSTSLEIDFAAEIDWLKEEKNISDRKRCFFGQTLFRKVNLFLNSSEQSNKNCQQRENKPRRLRWRRKRLRRKKETKTMPKWNKMASKKEQKRGERK